MNPTKSRGTREIGEKGQIKYSNKNESMKTRFTNL